MKGGIFLGWIQMLEKTYDACESIVGKKVNEDPILLPISHSTANAQLEVTIDMDGNFMPESFQRMGKIKLRLFL